MSLQQTLDKTLTKLKRKNFDLHLKITGLELDAIRVRIDNDMYGNEEDPVIISNGPIEAIIDYPPELPLFRSRSDNNENTISPNPDNNISTGTFFYEILPIELYTKWDDNVEVGDFIIHKIEDEQGEDLKIVLQVTDVLGSFRSSLIWKKSMCAMYNGEQEEFIKNLIGDF